MSDIIHHIKNIKHLISSSSVFNHKHFEKTIVVVRIWSDYMGILTQNRKHTNMLKWTFYKVNAYIWQVDELPWMFQMSPMQASWKLKEREAWNFQNIRMGKMKISSWSKWEFPQAYCQKKSKRVLHQSGNNTPLIIWYFYAVYNEFWDFKN